MFIFTVPQGHCAIVERFGKPVAVKASGLRFRIPIIDRLRDVSGQWGNETHKNGIFIELSEQILDTPKRQITTKDNVNLDVDAVIRWRLTDPIKAVYNVDHLHKSIVELVLNELRSCIGRMLLDEVLTGRAALSDRVTQNVASTFARWGGNLTAVEIQTLDVDQKTKDAMRQVMESERRARALAAEAEGESQSILKRAEANRQAEIMKAEGESEAMYIRMQAQRQYLQGIAEVVGEDMAAKILINCEALNCYSIITKDPAAKVFLPNSLPSVLPIDKV